MSEAQLRGSCLCGAVAYELRAEPVWAHNCHCSRCRKTHGTAFASNLFVPIDALVFTRGGDRLTTFRPADAERFRNAFCNVCGANMPFENPTRGLAVVPMGSLDAEPPFGPKAHIFVGSKAEWHEIRDSLPTHAEGRPSTE